MIQLKRWTWRCCVEWETSGRLDYDSDAPALTSLGLLVTGQLSHPVDMSRASMFPQDSGYTVAQERLLDKQREYDAFFKMFVQTTDLAKYFDAFADKYDVLDGGSEGEVPPRASFKWPR